MGADAVTLSDENDIEIMYHPLYPLKSLSLSKYFKEPLLHKVMENGEKVNKAKTLTEIADYSINRLEKLPEEYKRFDNPHIYKVGISNKLEAERNKLVDEFKK